MALEQQIQQLSDMVLQLQQNQARLEQENQVLRESQGGVSMLASAVGELAKSLEKKEDRRKSQILMDTKGLGRPESLGMLKGISENGPGALTTCSYPLLEESSLKF